MRMVQRQNSRQTRPLVIINVDGILGAKDMELCVRIAAESLKKCGNYFCRQLAGHSGR
jgi:hypothetical protein